MAKISLAVMLAVGAALLIRSFEQLRSTDPGFSVDRVVTMKISLPGDRYPDRSRRIEFFRDLLASAKALPHVTDAGLISRVPLRDNNVTTTLLFEDNPSVPMSRRPDAGFRIVSPGYFRTMGVPLRAGRDFMASDNADSGAVLPVIINETVARKHFSGRSPLGVRVQLGPTPPTGPWYTIVGVVGDVRDELLRVDPPPQVFISSLQSSASTLSLVLRTNGDIAPVVAAARALVKERDPALPVYDVGTTRENLDAASTGERFSTWLLGGFSALALLLAAVGVYGVMAYSVAERTREIGVRMAFGAREQDILRGVLGEVARTSGIALLLGLFAAIATSRVLGSLLYGVSPRDPAAFIAAAIVALGMALVAGIVPAWRAARLDPMEALRTE
jgi:putative ABC transport system permease protein